MHWFSTCNYRENRVNPEKYYIAAATVGQFTPKSNQQKLNAHLKNKFLGNPCINS